MDHTNCKELERAIHILIDKIESGIASDEEVLILPKLIKIKAEYISSSHC